VAQAADWAPKKPVEFVIMAGPGGGADKMARLIQTVIQKHDFSPKPFIPVNKPVGSGAEAPIHMKGKTGDEHTILTAAKTLALLSCAQSVPPSPAALVRYTLTFQPDCSPKR
jgi:tripartite-type tricarboxylate transporter receptor subunit TctC